MFAHADKTVRAEGTALVVELHRWLGPSVLSLLAGLKPVQIKELQDLCVQTGGGSLPPAPLRYLRSQKPVASVPTVQDSDAPMAVDAETVEQNHDSAATLVVETGTRPATRASADPYDLAEAVNISALLPANLHELLASASWKERKEALDGLLTRIKVVRIAEGWHNELVDALCKRIADVNVLVVIVGANCVEALATGLRGHFAPYRVNVVSALLERCKEKKQSVLDALRAALDAVRFCIPHVGETLLEETRGFFSHKNPSVRSETLLWMARLLKHSRQPPGKKDCRLLVELVLPAMDDGSTEVRDAAAETLACIWRILGDATIAPLLERLDKLKLNKIRELLDRTEVACSSAEKTIPTRPVPPIPTQTTGSGGVVSGGTPSLPPPLPAPRKTTAGSQLSAPPASKMQKMDTDVAVALSFVHTDEEAERFFVDWLGEETMSGLLDPAWKTRLTAVEELHGRLSAQDADIPMGFSAELLVRLFSKRPGWRESNFQVLGRVIACLLAASRVQFYTREAVALIIPAVVEKLSDPKLRKDCGELFSVFAEQVSLSFTLAQVGELARTQKSPKIQADIVKWMQGALQDFGLVGVPVAPLVDLCKSCLGNSNPTVRTVAVSLAGTLRSFVGADCRLLFTDISPATLAMLDAEFARVSSEPIPVPTRHCLGSGHGSGSGAHGHAHGQSQSPGSASLAMDDLIPRVNITAQVTDSLLAKMGDASWKVRKEALDELAQILTAANHRIKYTAMDLFVQLKARLTDSNKNLVLQTLELSGALAEALGSAFERHLKTLLPSLITTLADNKPQIRQAALKTLDKFHAVCPIGQLLPHIGPALLPDSPNIRRELMTWTATAITASTLPPNKDDLLELVIPVAGCLQDRSGDVRKAGQVLITAMLEHCSVEAVKRVCMDQHPKLLSTLQPILEAARSRGRSTAAAAAATAVAATVFASAPAPATVSVPASSSHAAPKTPQRTMSVRMSGPPRPTTPLKSSASLHNLTEEPRPLDEFPLLTADLTAKQARADKDKGAARWSFDAPRKDIVDFLREQMLGNVSYGLIGRLFSDDFKDHIGAMARVEEFLHVASDDESKGKFLANLDLLLKYLTLRLFDTNPSVLVKALELTETIVTFMDNCNYRLSEYEAASFLPFLIAKMGDGKESMRTRIHAIFRQVCRIYPASKLFMLFMEGLRNKNSRTRAECLDELATLLSRNGLSVLQAGRHLPAIGLLIADRDSHVRNAALNVCVQANQLMGNAALQKHLQGLSSRELDLLEERLRRAAAGIKEPPPTPDDDVDMTDAPLPQVISHEPMETEHPPQSPAGLASLSLPTPVLPSIRRSFEPSMLSHPLDQVIDQIQFSTDLVCIHALQRLETRLNEAAGVEEACAMRATECSAEQPPPADDGELKVRVNALTHALVVRLKEATSITFDIPDIAQLKSRLCRYVSNALVLVAANAALCAELDEEVVELVVAETLVALVSDRLPLFEDHDQLERALNVLVVKLLENVPQNRVYRALLTVLREAFRRPPTAGDKFPELVMKCLWKVTKQLAGRLQTPNCVIVSELLADVHGFLAALPPIEWKMRANEGLPFEDLPLRTVKTILHEVVQHCGLSVLRELSTVDDVEGSFVFSYLKAMLVARGFSEHDIISALDSVSVGMDVDVDMTGNDGVRNHANATDSMDTEHVERNQDVDVSHLTVEQIDVFLREVCSQICSKPDTRLGLQQLYAFRVAHPYAHEQIAAFLTGLGDFFHKYITRCLERLEAEHAQMAALQRSSSVSASGSSYNLMRNETSVDAYKSKLIQLRQQIFGGDFDGPSAATSSENQPPQSPTGLRRTNSHMDSPKMRAIRISGPATPTKLSAAMDLASAATATANASPAPHETASPSSILSLKERLARLRGESLSQQQHD